MTKIEIDQKGYVIGLCGLDLEKGDRLCEMSADQTLCLLPEKCEKGFATRIVTMDGDCRLVGKSARNLITDATAHSSWASAWDMSAYYGLYENRNKNLNKAVVGAKGAFYPIMDAQRNTSWINVKVITGVTGTARGAVIETSVGVNFQVTKTAPNVRADLMAIRVINHWLCQVRGVLQPANEGDLLGWLGWPNDMPYDVDVTELEMKKIEVMLGHIAMHFPLSIKHRKTVAEITWIVQSRDYETFRRAKYDWLDELLELE
ncbi:hypothetical protein [Weissella confusa]|uniref:hypothetical protein n=1 Tax=Weissella confusa TaxID=1583 RepID=UPI0022FDEE88|nr:hypothetical protein [Weissella confusa]MDA5457567.1 hypothetical protein [Weissella confusa]